MKLGVFTVCTPEYGISETAQLLSEIGFDGVEWRVGNPPPPNKPADYSYDQRYWSYNMSTIDLKTIVETASALKKTCDQSKLEIYSLTTYLEPKDLDSITQVMRAATIMGCPNIRVNAPRYDEKENYRVLFDRTIDQIKTMEQLATKHKIRVNLEIHMGNIIPSASAAYRLVSQFDPQFIGIIYDPGNMVHEGFENYPLGLELLGEYLACVHIKNAVWKQDKTLENDIDSWKATWAPLKKGIANLPKLITSLKKCNYNGYLSIEDFTNETETQLKLKESLQFLKSQL